MLLSLQSATSVTPFFILSHRQSTPESWAEFSHDNIVRAEHERLASQQLRNLIDQILTDTSNDMREQCNTVNSEFARRIEEMNDAKTKMENHLLKVKSCFVTVFFFLFSWL